VNIKRLGKAINEAINITNGDVTIYKSNNIAYIVCSKIVISVSFIYDFVATASALRQLLPCNTVISFVDIPLYPIGDIVYFLRSGKYVKVGFSSDICQRIATINIYTPEVCQLYGYIYGDQSLEHSIHALLARHWHRGEWFVASKVFYSDLESVPGFNKYHFSLEASLDLE
jgi:hypothetical protein